MSRSAILSKTFELPIPELATAGAVIDATALHHGASLLTCDAHFSGLVGVIYVPKVRA